MATAIHRAGITADLFGLDIKMRGKVFHAELPQSIENGQKLFAGFGQFIFHSWRNFRIDRSFDEVIVFELAELFGEREK